MPVVVPKEVIEEYGVLIEEVTKKADHGLQLPFQGGVVLWAAIQIHGQFYVVFGKELPGQVIFASIVAIKGALGNPCRGGDILNGGPDDPLFHKEMQGGFVDQFFGLPFYG